MKRIVTFKITFSLDHTQKYLTEALGISADRYRFMQKRLAWIHKKTEYISQMIEMVLVDTELKSAEKILILTELKKSSDKGKPFGKTF